jgi:sec-independent protein translocase protein TatA
MHLVVILIIALVVLGPKRLPEAGRGLGEALRGFKESISASPRAEEELPAPRPSAEDPQP